MIASSQGQGLNMLNETQNGYKNGGSNCIMKAAHQLPRWPGITTHPLQ